MKKIKINLIGFWNSFNPEKNFLRDILNKYYSTEISKNPEYLFYGHNGCEHLSYDDCVKIFYAYV